MWLQLNTMLWNPFNCLMRYLVSYILYKWHYYSETEQGLLGSPHWKQLHCLLAPAVLFFFFVSTRGQKHRCFKYNYAFGPRQHFPPALSKNKIPPTQMSLDLPSNLAAFRLSSLLVLCQLGALLPFSVFSCSLTFCVVLLQILRMQETCQIQRPAFVHLSKVATQWARKQFLLYISSHPAL